MRRHFAPGHEQLDGQVRHIGQALAQHAPESIVLLIVRVGHAVEEQLAQAAGHLRRGPFRRPPVPVGVGGGRQRTLFAGHIPEQTKKGRAAHGERLALFAFLLLVQPSFHGLGIVYLEDGRLETEVALAGQQGPAVGGNAVHVGIAAGKFGKPLGGGFGQFPLGHFPEFGHGDGGGQGLAALAAFLQQADGLFPPGQGAGQLRAGPGQQARCPQARFAAIGQEEAHLASALLGDEGQMNGIALQKFHNAARAGILHTR